SSDLKRTWFHGSHSMRCDDLNSKVGAARRPAAHDCASRSLQSRQDSALKASSRPIRFCANDIASKRLVSAGEIPFLLDLAKGRKARLPSPALRLCQGIEAFKHRNAVPAQACRDRRTIRKMLANGVKPDRSTRKKAAGAGRIGKLQHPLEFLGRS